MPAMTRPDEASAVLVVRMWPVAGGVRRARLTATLDTSSDAVDVWVHEGIVAIQGAVAAWLDAADEHLGTAPDTPARR